MPETTICYDVKGDIPVIQQPNGMACWATVATMLMSWHDEVCYSIESAMQIAGEEYSEMFARGEGLPAEKHQQFANSCGMTIEYPQCYNEEGIQDLLVNFGPVIVITDEDTTEFFAIHARILKGIDNETVPGITYLTIIDPANGTEYREKFEDFSSKFEAVDGAPRIQVMHF